MVKLRKINGIEDIERVSHLSALVFFGDDYERKYQWFKDRYLHCPYVSENLCWVAEVDGQIVSKAQIIDYKMHIGSSTVRMGGVASVLTDPPHRGNGYAKMVLEKCIEFMAESGFDVSVLFDITGDFYESVGYTPAMPDYEVTVEVSDVRGENVDGFRKMKEEDIDHVLELYHRSNEDRTGAISRPKNAWKWMHRKPSLFLVSEDGYIGVNFSDDAVELTDIAGESEKFYDKAILKLGSMARERDLKSIKAFVPPDHPFALMAVKHGSKITVFQSRTGNCMARIINIDSLFEKIYPEFEHRIETSLFNGIGVDLTIQSDVGKANITLNEDCLVKANLRLELPQTAVTHLVMGYKPAGIVLTENNLSFDGASVKVLETLLPQGFPFVWRSDRF